MQAPCKLKQCRRSTQLLMQVTEQGMELHLVQPDLPGGPPVIGGCCRLLIRIVDETDTQVRLSYLQPTLPRSAAGRSDTHEWCWEQDTFDVGQRLT